MIISNNFLVKTRIGRFIKKLFLKLPFYETKEEDWISKWGFKYFFCKKPLWINFIPIPVRIIRTEIEDSEVNP